MDSRRLPSIVFVVALLFGVGKVAGLAVFVIV
jgi:hypothetical protein